MNKELLERKNNLKYMALEKDYSNGALIYQLINENYLDHIIAKLDNRKTKTNTTSIVKKGYLTSEEQFIDMLNNFIFRFDKDFGIVGSGRKLYIETLFENSTPKFVLCKNYWGDNNFIPYFQYNIKLFIANNFYTNIKELYPTYKDFFKELGINDRMSLKNQKSLDIIYNFFKDIAWYNYDSFSLYFAFMNIHNYKPVCPPNTSKEQINKIVRDYYITQWDNLIDLYIKNIESVRNFKKY